MISSFIFGDCLMRKIHQSVPDVPQAVANKAIDIIERHFTTNGARHAGDLPEESRVHLLRELESFFRLALPARIPGKESEPLYDRSRRSGFPSSIFRWLERVLHGDDV